MSARSNTLFACVHAVEFPAQALLRLRPNFSAEPVAVLDGRAPQEFVCAMNSHALRRGIALGMTRLDCEALPGVRLLARSTQTEAAARAVMLEHAAKFSPRIEEASNGTGCAFALDIAGTERLFGPPVRLAQRLRNNLAGAGFRVSIAVSVNYDAARMKAFTSRGITVIPEGEEAVALAKLPVDALRLAAKELADEDRETFAMWGIRTLGEIAALPVVDLIARMGQKARAWSEAAWGLHPHMFRPLEPEFTLREFLEFDTPVEEVDSLLFIGARMIDCLIARATGRALALASLTVHLKLEGGAAHSLKLRPAVPSADRKFLLKLLQLEIAAHPPQSAVIAVELQADAAQITTVQLGLFVPQTPEPSRLDVTLARLKAIVGEDRVGAIVLVDTHRRGSFRISMFSGQAVEANEEIAKRRAALRCVRPPRQVRVTVRNGQPAAFFDGEYRYEVAAAYGPWHSSGCWWSSETWDTEEWDVLAGRKDGAALACLLVREAGRNEWRLEAVYD